MKKREEETMLRAFTTVSENVNTLYIKVNTSKGVEQRWEYFKFTKVAPDLVSPFAIRVIPDRLSIRPINTESCEWVFNGFWFNRSDIIHETDYWEIFDQIISKLNSYR